MSDETVHGFGLPPGEHALLRDPPPPVALAWVARAVGAGSTVRDVVPMEGGTSSAVHALVVEDRRGHAHALVLRRFVRADWLAEEPDVPAREAAALELLAGCRVPAPRLVAVDASGAEAGIPALLMTRLPGQIEWRPADLEGFLTRLSAELPRIHDVRVPPGSILPPYAPYALRMRRPPAWAARPEVWLRAIAALDDPPPAVAETLIHRDFHPGNVLWAGAEVTGIIDWAVASRGVPDADVGHCRVNLNGAFGPAAAERFLDLHRAVSGRTEPYHPYWDIGAALGGMDEGRDAEPDPADEAFLAAAVARL